MATVEPHVFVIFGATGDLARRKLLPALEQLDRGGRIPAAAVILAVGRRPELDDGSYRSWASAALVAAGREAGAAQAWCEAHLRYHALVGDGFSGLARRIEALEAERGLWGRRILYLALPPGSFPEHIQGLGQAGLHRSAEWTRLVIEKPFGRDLASAQELNGLAHAYFDETQIYRIDHYLGKDTVQNLLTFRFANALFESVWNRERIEWVEITSVEQLGVERRAGYYEQSGALRDMVQNHLAQVLTLVAMEPPARLASGPVRNEKIKVLEAIEPLRPRDVVFGQYGPGRIDGREVPGYLDEPGVAPGSTTATYVGLRLQVANWRWQGVPFYLRTGKRLGRRLTRVTVTFTRPPICLFKSLGACEMHSNVLSITLQPDEGFDLYFDVRTPGETLKLRTLPLRFRYSEAFAGLTEAYQTLLLDVMSGDQTLFVHADETEASWRLFTPLLAGSLPLYTYAAGSAGPAEAETLLLEDGHRWQDL